MSLKTSFSLKLPWYKEKGCAKINGPFALVSSNDLQPLFKNLKNKKANLQVAASFLAATVLTNYPFPPPNPLPHIPTSIKAAVISMETSFRIIREKKTQEESMHFSKASTLPPTGCMDKNVSENKVSMLYARKPSDHYRRLTRSLG